MKRLCVPLSAMLKDSLIMEEHIAVTLITYGFTLSQEFVCNQSATEVAPLSTLSRSYQVHLRTLNVASRGFSGWELQDFKRNSPTI